MKKAADPHAGGELVQRIEDQEPGSRPEAAGGVTRPRAADAQEHRERGERDPPAPPIRVPRQDQAPDHEPRAGQDPHGAGAEEARARDLGDGPAGARLGEDRELDPQGEQLRGGDDRHPDGRQRETSRQARASGRAFRERWTQLHQREEHAADGDRLPAQG